MLKSLSIQGFQSWRKVYLNFHTGMNVIIGDSQTGKSALMKAIDWVLRNRPMSSNILNLDVATPRSTVLINTYDDEKVRLTKSFKATNTAVYSINNQPLRKFKTSVPAEVPKVLKLTDVNIQRQGDQPFLITSSSGAISKEINKITNIEQSDKWVKSLTSQIDQSTSKIKFATQDIDILKDVVKKYKGLEDLEEGINRLTEIEDEIEELETKVDEIEECVSEVKILDGRIEIANSLYKALRKDVRTFKKLSKKLDKQKLLYKTLTDYKIALTSVDMAEEELEGLISQYKKKLKKSGTCPTCQTKISPSLLAGLKF